MVAAGRARKAGSHDERLFSELYRGPRTWSVGRRLFLEWRHPPAAEAPSQGDLRPDPADVARGRRIGFGPDARTYSWAGRVGWTRLRGRCDGSDSRGTSQVARIRRGARARGRRNGRPGVLSR